MGTTRGLSPCRPRVFTSASLQLCCRKQNRRGRLSVSVPFSGRRTFFLEVHFQLSRRIQEDRQVLRNRLCSASSAVPHFFCWTTGSIRQCNKEPLFSSSHLVLFVKLSSTER